MSSLEGDGMNEEGDMMDDQELHDEGEIPN